ncbi:MAG: hypothetical protein EXR63_01985 [Dehalococcoidia bacterium]|nr:hypothetical protein [Dehalococcoidia bacterium]
MVFNDRRAAELRDAVLADRATAAEAALYDRAFVAMYIKNGQTGSHRYTYCPGGFVAAIDCTERRY